MRLWRRLFDTAGGTKERLLQRHALLAAVIFAAQAVWVCAHLITGGHYAGLHAPTGVVIDSALTALWTVSTAAMLLRWSPLVYIALLGCGASFSHGLLVSVSQPFSGIPFLVSGCVVTYAVFRSLPLFRAQVRGPSVTGRAMGSP